MNQYIEEFKNKVRKFEVNNFLAIDTTHGFNVVDMIYNEIMLFDVNSTLVIYNTLEAESQILAYEKSIGLQFKKLNLYGELTIYKDGKISIREELLGGVSNVVVWSMNYITEEVFRAIVTPMFAVPIFFIGDSEKWSVDNFCHSLLVKTSFYASDINRIIDYNLEISYLNKRIRNGSIVELEPIDHRSYLFKKVNFEDVAPEDYLNYDMVISALPNTADANNLVRELFSYTTLPNINEPMITVESAFVQLDDGSRYYIEAYSILKVLEIKDPHGHPSCRFSYTNGHQEIEFTIHINTKHLDDMVQKYGDIDVPHNTGLKVEYAYVIPPIYAIGKAWDNVLILFSNPINVSIKKPIYELTTHAKKKLTFLTDYWYKIY